VAKIDDVEIYGKSRVAAWHYHLQDQ
jgi:hypothetical protein